MDPCAPGNRLKVAGRVLRLRIDLSVSRDFQNRGGCVPLLLTRDFVG